MHNFHIITGGPGVGKTTLIKALSSKGFLTVAEDARQIIKTQMDIKGQGLPWKNKPYYTKLMLDAAIKSYSQICTLQYNEPVFFDRGLLDTVCYMRMEGIPVSEDIERMIRKYRYAPTVFILPPWKEIYETDDERRQNWDEAFQTFSAMQETYLNYGYSIIEVPRDDVEKRVEFVMGHTVQ